MAKKTTTSASSKQAGMSYEDAMSSITSLSKQMQPAMTDLLTRLKAFNDKCKVTTNYRPAVHDNDLSTSGIEISNVHVPKTLLNFLLSKYLGANKNVKRKPSALRLLAMLYKHQQYRVRYNRRLLVMLDDKQLAQPAKEDLQTVSMVSTADNTTLAPEVGLAAGDMPAELGAYTIWSAAGKMLKTVNDVDALTDALAKLGKRWRTVCYMGKVIRTNRDNKNAK